LYKLCDTIIVIVILLFNEILRNTSNDRNTSLQYDVYIYRGNIIVHYIVYEMILILFTSFRRITSPYNDNDNIMIYRYSVSDIYIYIYEI